MKPFNLEDALAGKPVVTRDGRKVTEIHHYKTTKSQYKVHACIGGYIREFTTEGKYYDMGGESEFDLAMDEPIIEGWVNVYYDEYDGKLRISGNVYHSKEFAINNSCGGYVKTIKINNKPEYQ